MPVREKVCVWGGYCLFVCLPYYYLFLFVYVIFCCILGQVLTMQPSGLELAL